ncbi:MAG: hypothetical protein KDJ52_16640 [Anaerolineae bacterium]|nr:hypothetical protein [Anaerolineae bacterium]
MAVQQVTPIVCSNCRTQYNAPINNIINGQDQVMKGAFLQGRINLSQCPQCGTVNRPDVPILYYDLEKELALVLAPGGLTLDKTTQEKMIGTLTNSLINSLPTEQRKFYLFNPQQFLSLESMVKAVLKADGITEEMLDQQAARTKLIQEFMQAPDEDTLKELVKTHDEELDYEFFEILTAYMQAANMEGDQNRAQTFYALRTVLARWSTKGKEAVAEIDKKIGLVVLENQEELLDRLSQATTDEEIEGLVAAGHGLLDYTFFQKLTDKIDRVSKAGDTASATALRELRSKVLEIKAHHEEQSRIVLERAGNLLKEILQSSRPDKVIDENLDQIDEAFFFILSANIDEARRQGHNETAQALEMIGNLTMAKLQGIDLSEMEADPEPPAEQPQEKPQIHISRR